MLLTRSEVKSYKGIDNDVHDAEIDRLIVAVRSFLTQYCHRTFEANATILEFHSGRSGQSRLLVRQPPINSIASLYDDPLRIYGASTLIPTTDYIIEHAEAGIIKLDGRTFGNGLNNIRLLYAGGFAPLAQPPTPVITNQGTPGSAAYGYKIVAVNERGATEASLEGTTATGATTLGTVNYNKLTWTAVAGAIGYEIYRVTGGPNQGLIGVALDGVATTFNDQGGLGDTLPAPKINTTGIPPDVRHAAIELIWLARDKGEHSLLGMRAKSIGDGNISLLDNNWPAGVQDILNHYRLDNVEVP